ncbi:hypothetical protein [Penaeicola halotolerans]|uniref:hypothetical protein n=1 Tax=Penaeicola halotolerans TaxID=2793196 RepID=UPI001CF864EA|nr:hypothetical protein [Penaeicola halotolerans]
MKQFVFLSIFVIVALTSIQVSLAQDALSPKVEREVSIKQRDVPQPAKDWLVDTFEDIKRPNWYKEFNEIGYSYEAKFKLKNHFYSVKFDSLGIILDVEIELKLSELSEELQLALKDYFTANYETYQINKIQIQYTGLPDDLEDFFDEDEKEGITTRYEIEYRGKVDSNKDEIWEALFTEKGKFIQKRVIKVSSTDNLIF